MAGLEGKKKKKTAKPQSSFFIGNVDANDCLTVLFKNNSPVKIAIKKKETRFIFWVLK